MSFTGANCIPQENGEHQPRLTREGGEGEAVGTQLALRFVP